ncbi:MAG: TonB-dependent receptor [Bacteroidota bacterium]
MKLNLKFVWLITCLLASRFALLSQCAIQGKLSDTLQAPVPYNAIGLLNDSDSSIVKGAMTDADGNYCFESLQKGVYRLKISAIGYQTFFSGKIEYDSIHPILNPLIQLRTGAINLNEVSVAAQKKTVEFKNGNITVNVEGTALAMGNTVYDLLLRLPGVIVNDGDISIQGKQGVRVMIDGKIQNLSGQQLINVLKGMSASQIEKIEILKKPPVKYDAAGAAGMINIKTNKLKLVGFSGSLFANYSQGFYGTPAGGFSLNYKARKVNFFSGFNVIKEQMHRVTDYKNYITYNGIETTVHQSFQEKEHNQAEGANLGMDWFIDKKNSIGIKLHANFGMDNVDRQATTYMSDNSLGYNALQYNSKKPNPWIYPESNFNAEHLFDTTGTALRLSIDYNPYWDIYAANFDNHFLDRDQNEVTTPLVFRTSNTLLFTYAAANLDFEKTFKKDIKLETGLKHGFMEILSDYNLQYQDYTTGHYSTDTAFTNVFDYQQNISAGYINISKEFDKLSFQLGVRGENMLIDARSKASGLTFHRQYFNLFPLLTLDYEAAKDHNFSLSYNRRIDRPDYNAFNPFRQFRSLLTTQKGNPYLQPQYVHVIDVTYSYDSWFNHTLSYARTAMPMIDYNIQNDSSKTTITTGTNLKWANYYGYTLFIQKDVFKWWSINLNATVFHIKAYGFVNDLPYTSITTAFNPGLYSRVTLPKNFSIELNSFYLTPFLQGVTYYGARNLVNITFKKSFMQDKLSVALAFNDIFNGLKMQTSFDYQNQRSFGVQTFDSRRINLSINYNFGKLKVEQREIKDKDPLKTGK